MLQWIQENYMYMYRYVRNAGVPHSNGILIVANMWLFNQLWFSQTSYSLAIPQPFCLVFDHVVVFLSTHAQGPLTSMWI